MMNFAEQKIKDRRINMVIKRVNRIIEQQKPNIDLATRELALEKKINMLQGYFGINTSITNNIEDLFERLQKAQNAEVRDPAKEEYIKRQMNM